MNCVRLLVFPILAIVLPSCFGAVREEVFLREWTLPDGDPRPLRLEVDRGSDGSLRSVRVSGLVALYREAPSPEGPVQLPAWRDLLLAVDLELDGEALRAPAESFATWRFHKVSPRVLGPRTYYEPVLTLRVDGVEYSTETRSRTGSSSKYWAEWQEAKLPLGTLLAIGRAESFEGRLSSLSPFELDAADRQTLRSLDELLEAAGIDTKALPALSPLAQRRDEARAGAGGSIWGFHWDRETPTHQSRIVQVSSYSGPIPHLRTLRPTSWIEFPEGTVDGPRVARLEGREGDAPLRLPLPGRDDEQLAWRLATIVSAVLHEEFGLEAPPPLWVLVFPVAERAAWRFVLQTPIGRGVAFGAPSVGGRIDDEDASALLWLMAHEYAEGLLILPYLGKGSALYRSSPFHRWLGDGVAELVGALAFRRARELGLELPPPGSDLDWLLEELEQGTRVVQLENWEIVNAAAAVRQKAPSESQTPGSIADDETATDDKSRYLAAEYFCARWYTAAKERGCERPLAELLDWLARHPDGPPSVGLEAWLNAKSGLAVAAELRGVRLEDVLRYHTEKWRSLGWKLPRGAALPGSR